MSIIGKKVEYSFVQGANERTSKKGKVLDKILMPSVVNKKHKENETSTETVNNSEVVTGYLIEDEITNRITSVIYWKILKVESESSVI